MVMPISSLGMGTSFGMGMSSGNVNQMVLEKYGCGYIDHYDRPTVNRYPVGTNPMYHKPYIAESWFGRVIRKILN